jgi:Flp pilus assembly protein TadG
MANVRHTPVCAHALRSGTEGSPSRVDRAHRRRWRTPADLVRDCRGQSTVEFALVIPIIALIIFGCLKIGLVFFNYEQVASAANAGARAAAVNHGTDPTAIARTAARSISPTVGLSDSQIAVTYASTASPPGLTWSYPGTVTVTITYPVTFSFLGQLPQQFNLQATATKRLER